MTRFKAAGIHLLLSIFIVACVLLLMHFVWYPKGFFKLLGGSELVNIIAGVDVCLGPLLTLVVFNPAKKLLKLDLTIIGVLQICALIYGASVMLQARPAFIVLQVVPDRLFFKVSLANDFKNNEDLLLAKQPQWRQLSWTGPQLVAAVGPTDVKENQELVFAALTGKDWNMIPKLFVTYESQKALILKEAKTLDSLRSLNAKNAPIIDAFLNRSAQPIISYVYLPIVNQYTIMTAVLDAKDAKFIEILEVTPP